MTYGPPSLFLSSYKDYFIKDVLLCILALSGVNLIVLTTFVFLGLSFELQLDSSWMGSDEQTSP